MDSTYFQVRSIKKKGKHEKYSMEVQNEKYTTEYMKRIGYVMSLCYDIML